LLLAEDLADRAAIAIDNAMLYSKEQEANRVKDEFLATVSHELRTPLTPILGAIFKLKAKRRDDAELMAVLDMIERNAKTQSRIVEDLLDISRITTGKLEFKRQVLELKPIVESALEVVRPAADALGIQLETVVDKLPRPIHCDRNRIQQVVWNLLSNAIKFTPSGGRVQVRLEDRHNVARIRVTDAGGSQGYGWVTVAAALSLSPATAVIAPDETQLLVAAGGFPPYAFSLVSGTGVVGVSSGVYAAPSSPGTATVRVTDVDGNTAESAITILFGPTIAPATAALAVNNSLDFNATDGTPPYSFSVVSGGGTINGATGLYVAPSAGGTPARSSITAE